MNFGIAALGLSFILIFADAKVSMEDFKYNSNKKYLISTMSISSVGEGIKYDTNITTLVDYVTVVVSIALALANIKNGEPEKFLLNSTTNICKLKDGFIGNFVVQSFFAEIPKFSNIKLECPLNKGDYYIKDYVISDKLIPSNFLIGLPDVIKFRIFQQFFARLEPKKPLVKIYDASLLVKYSKN